ncbi:AMP phosphorylase [Haloarchaeobius iranensis]|uniref:AMP phosphorylase n=1 Tax=Haloarchaeobius iranensis TaxID=996166 RepID=A0A1G9ZBT0_9EURY|nr:AMP phosphorylase [Haloarchaeobius iranensis]SDN18537.1 AMP phosphorylase [Haloarchaeobius iranensis]
MDLTAREIDIATPTPTVILHTADAEELGAHPLDRLRIEQAERTYTGVVETTTELVEEGVLAVTSRLGHVTGPVTVSLAPKPRSVAHIRTKLEDHELEQSDLQQLVRDIDRNRLTDVELGAYVAALHANGLSHEETRHLTQAMTDIGERLDWSESVVADKHSIGGVAGNRVTPIIVPIVAAAGVTIPKTSSRAITSPAGTADTMAVFCDVEFTTDEVREVVEETGGCLVWGGGVELSPVDDKIIRAENPLSVDPPGQVIASVLSKKKSAGSNRVLIDIPYGEHAKVTSLVAARDLAEDFRLVAEHLDIDIACTITRGGQPIGEGIGPILEARDVLAVLDGGGPLELRLKSVRLADILFDLCDVDADATELLDSGAALEKFREIVAAQGGDPDVARDDLRPGERRHVVTAGRDGIVLSIQNRTISQVARRAGAPRDAGAGIRLHCREGDAVEAEDELFTVYAEKAGKLTEAVEYNAGVEAVRIGDPDEALIERR